MRFSGVQHPHVKQIAAQIGRILHGAGRQQPGQRTQSGQGEHAAQAKGTAQPAAQRAADKGAEKLAAGIEAHRRALGVRRGHFGDQRGQRRLQQIKAGEENQQQRSQFQHAVVQAEQAQFGQRQRQNRAKEYRLQPPMLLREDDERDDSGHRKQQRRQIDSPMLVAGQSGVAQG